MKVRLEEWTQSPVTKVLFQELLRERTGRVEGLVRGSLLKSTNPMAAIQEYVGVIKLIDEIISLDLIRDIEIQEDIDA